MEIADVAAVRDIEHGMVRSTPRVGNRRRHRARDPSRHRGASGREPALVHNGAMGEIPDEQDVATALRRAAAGSPVPAGSGWTSGRTSSNGSASGARRCCRVVDEERVTRLATGVLADVARLRELARTADLVRQTDQLDAVKYRFVT